jgi:hypothetical protein
MVRVTFILRRLLRKFPNTVEKLEGVVSIFCSNPGVDKGILVGIDLKCVSLGV